MKNFKSILCASFLAVVLSSNAFAGIITVTKATPGQPDTNTNGIIVVTILKTIAGMVLGD